LKVAAAGLDEAGLPTVVPYSWRHTAGTGCSRLGCRRRRRRNG
jgi:hypothetical protein